MSLDKCWFDEIGTIGFRDPNKVIILPTKDLDRANKELSQTIKDCGITINRCKEYWKNKYKMKNSNNQDTDTLEKRQSLKVQGVPCMPIDDTILLLIEDKDSKADSIQMRVTSDNLTVLSKLANIEISGIDRKKTYIVNNLRITVK